MKDTIALGATIGTVVGGIGGAAVGCALGGIAVARALPWRPALSVARSSSCRALSWGAWRARRPWARLGAAGGMILVTAPVAIGAAVQYFTTINEPFVPAPAPVK